MMKLTRLLPFGIALLTTFPLAAQTSQGGPNPANDRASDAPETRQHAVPPTPPMPPSWQHLEELRMLNQVRPDSLRRLIEFEVQRNLEENAGLRMEMRRIEKEIRSKAREIQLMKSRAKGDTTGMSEALRLAQQSLDEARLSLKQLDSSFPAEGSFQMPRFSVMVETNDVDASGEQRVTVLVQGDSSASCMNGRRVTTMARSFAGREGSGAFIFNSNDSLPCVARARAMAQLEGNGGNGGSSVTRHRVLVISEGDSSSANFLTTSDGGGRSQVIIRNIEGCSPQALRSHTVYVRRFTSDELPLAHFPATLPHGASMPLVVRDNLILVGNDTLNIQDGEDRQMMIRVYRDSSSTEHHTSVVVITSSRQRKADTLTGGTSQVEDLDAARETSGTSGYMLEANRPNPFSASTAINFTIPTDNHVNLTIFDAAGTPVRVLKDEMTLAGSHTVSFDAGDLPSGVYFYRFVAGGFSETKTMTVAK